MGEGAPRVNLREVCRPPGRMLVRPSVTFYGIGFHSLLRSRGTCRGRDTPGGDIPSCMQRGYLGTICASGRTAAAAGSARCAAVRTIQAAAVVQGGVRTAGSWGYIFTTVHQPRLAKEFPRVPVEIVRRSDSIKGFKVLPRRWAVERTLPGSTATDGWPKIPRTSTAT